MPLIRVFSIIDTSGWGGRPKGEGMISKRRKDPLDALVGARIRARRIEKNLSAQDLGDAVKLPEREIERIESGAAHAGGERLMAIATILGLKSPLAFFRDAPLDPKPGQQAVSSPIAATKETKEIIALFSKAKSSRDRKALLLFADYLILDKPLRKQTGQSRQQV